MSIFSTITGWFTSKPIDVVKKEPLTADERLFLALIREQKRQNAKDALKKVKENE